MSRPFLLIVGILLVCLPQHAAIAFPSDDALTKPKDRSPDDWHKYWYSKFETLKDKDPPIKLGSKGDRVRELQSTLNAVFSELDKTEIFKLRSTIYVGPPTPVGNQPRDQVRKVYVDRREKAFHIRGDWKPFIGDEEEGPFKEVTYNTSDPFDLMPTNAIDLPEQLLKVDGVFGQHTQAAVMLFQFMHSLPVTGEVDAVTLDKLEPMLPTNPLLATIMRWVKDGPFFRKASESYPYWVKTLTSIIMTLLILLVSTVVFQIARMVANSTNFLSRWLFTPTSSPWFTALKANKVFLLAAQFAPALFIYFAGMTIFPVARDGEDPFPYLNTFQNWHDYVSRLGLAMASVVFMRVGFGVVNTSDDIYNPDKETDNPISGIIRATKRFVGLVGAILICASLAGRSPLLIVGGLGGFMAVIILVFRDYLLGVVASVQIIANKVVKVGDWIAMPKYHADGDVKEISLTLIKVENFDKTISTIPTNAVLTESFRNWTSMQTSGGRRIKRSILIDIDSIKVCSPDMVERFGKIELIHDYIIAKRDELDEYNRKHDRDASAVNCRQLTNIGTFRAYLEAYLRNHSGLSEEMTFLVRHLQPTNNGLPIEIYAFCKETEWKKYEAIQADIFDHVLAILPEFELQAFQDISDMNPSQLGDSSADKHSAARAEIESIVDDYNKEMHQNRRLRISNRLEKVKSSIEQLGLSDQLKAEGSNRTITLRDLRKR